MKPIFQVYSSSDWKLRSLWPPSGGGWPSLPILLKCCKWCLDVPATFIIFIDFQDYLKLTGAKKVSIKQLSEFMNGVSLSECKSQYCCCFPQTGCTSTCTLQTQVSLPLCMSRWTSVRMSCRAKPFRVLSSRISMEEALRSNSKKKLKKQLNHSSL